MLVYSEPSLISEEGDKRRWELPLPSKGNITPGALRPSQYHYVMQDRLDRVDCFIIKHCRFFVLWVSEGLSPLLAVACALSTGVLTESLSKSKHCLLS